MPAAPDECPNCGADVPKGASACPECGACEETGWSDSAYAGRLGIPDDSFDYNDFVEREFGSKRRKTSSTRWLWALVALVLILVLLSAVF